MMKPSHKAWLVMSAGGWLAYVAVLAPIVTHAITRFAALYAADSLTSEPQLSDFYKAFVGWTNLALAIWLGLVAAAFGMWRRSVLQGLLALTVGAGTTIVALSITPLVRFPEDQYPPAALWVIADLPALVVAFVVATVSASLITTGTNLKTATGETTMRGALPLS